MPEETKAANYSLTIYLLIKLLLCKRAIIIKGANGKLTFLSTNWNFVSVKQW